MPIADLVDLDDQLLAALARDRVVVPSALVRDAMIAAFDRHQLNMGRTAWLAPNVAPLDEHLIAHFEALALHGELADMRLLDAHEQRGAWRALAHDAEKTIAASAHASIASAWQLLHEYALGDAALQNPLTASQRYFTDACRAYERKAARERWLTFAELPGVLARATANADTNAREPVTLFGFGRLPIAHERYFAALGQGAVRRHSGRRLPHLEVRYSGHDDPDDEFAAAVSWARDVLVTDPAASIGILVPDTTERRSVRIRQLDAELRPALALSDPATSPYAMSGGIRLSDTLVGATALDLLRWIDAPLERAKIAALLGTPLFHWHDTPSIERALPQHATLRAFADLSGDTLANAIAAKTRDWRRPRAVRLWTREVIAVLDLAHSSGASAWRTTIQARDALVRAVEGLRTSVSSDAPIAFADLLRDLEDAWAATTFAPERPRARLRILDYEETAGLHFTHLRVIGLDDRSFPARPSPNPYLRADVQRAAGIPRSSVELERRFCREQIERWRQSADTLHFSFAREHDDDSRGPSPLVGPWPEKIEARRQIAHPYRQRRAVALEPSDDSRAPVAMPHFARRGAQLLIEQKSCPFKSFARNRLDLAAERPPHDFPDAIDQGELVHRALEAYASAYLGERLAIDDAVLDRALATAIATWRRFPQPVVALERRRLKAALARYLAHDARRAPYAIEGIEVEVATDLGGIRLRLRVDRIDCCNGGRLVIDYKTGRRRTSSAPDDDLQLPLYASALPDVIGICRVDLRSDAARSSTIAARSEDVVSETSNDLRVTVPNDTAGAWAAQLERWETEVVEVARAYLAGDARVAPQSAASCRGCGLESLCRIGRRFDDG